MKTVRWDHRRATSRQLNELTRAARDLGFLVVEFEEGGDGRPASWSHLEPWIRCRSISVADIRGRLASPALEVALCCDLVYLRRHATLRLSVAGRVPSPGVLWALGCRGRTALARGLLDDRDLEAEAAVGVGLGEAVVATSANLPLPSAISTAALTAARDLLRANASGRAGRGLELASFRLLFASGDPERGARAFLDKRPPGFSA